MLAKQSRGNPNAVEGAVCLWIVRAWVRDISEQEPPRADRGAPQAGLQEGSKARNVAHLEAFQMVLLHVPLADQHGGVRGWSGPPEDEAAVVSQILCRDTMDGHEVGRSLRMF